jgi:hypothetical protein
LIAYRPWQEWPSPSTNNYDLIAMATNALVTLHPHAAKVHKLWLSLLVQPGTLLLPKSEGNSIKQAIFVLATSIFGVLGVPVSLKKLNHNNYFARLELEAAEHASPFWRQKLVVDENAWVTIPVSPLPPCVAAHTMGKVKFSIYLELPSLACTPILTYAAKQAFKGMTVPMMQRLVSHLKLEFERGGKPTREWDVTQTLVKHVLPKAAPGEVEAIMAKRDACPTPVYTTYLTTKAMDACRDAMDADEFDNAVHELERESKKVSRSQAKAPHKPKASAKPPRKPTARAPRPDPSQNYTQEEAKAFLPIAKGCTIIKDIKLHMRWQVHYPRTSSPFSMSCAFGANQHEALLVCLRWVWEQHVLHGGEACPWQ